MSNSAASGNGYQRNGYSSNGNASPDGHETPTKRSRNDIGPSYPQHSYSMPATNAPPSFNAHQPTLPLPMSPVSSNSNVTSLSSPRASGAPIRTCLLIIDVQNDFCTGSLKAPDALSIIPVINQLRVKWEWDLVVFTTDAHPTDHVSFYINHAKDPKAQLYKPYQLPNGMVQVLWPVHCVKDTWGAHLHNDLIKDPQNDVIVEKGTEVDQEFYSAFVCTDGVHRTNLSSILTAHGITHVAACGLVFEFCVGNSALDATSEGFKTTVITDATRGLTPDGMKEMREKFLAAGVAQATSIQLASHGFRPKLSLRNVPRTMPTSPTTARSPTSARHVQHTQLSGVFASAAPSSQHRPMGPHPGALLSRSPSLMSEYNLPALSPLSTPTSSVASSTTTSTATPTPRLSPTHSRAQSAFSTAAASSSASTALPAPPRPKVLLGLSGSVATIKISDLLSLLTQWAEVRVICTGRSKHFFSASEIQQQWGVMVYEDEDEWKPWKRGDSVLHVDLRRWADLMIVAPLSANTLAKISNGLCDNLLTTVIRCWSFSTHPLLLAPAMNTVMWDSPFTRSQLDLMQRLGVSIIEPQEKTLACGDIGKGAMANVTEIDQVLRMKWRDVQLKQQPRLSPVLVDEDTPMQNVENLQQKVPLQTMSNQAQAKLQL